MTDQELTRLVTTRSEQLSLSAHQRHWLSSRLMHPEGGYALQIIDAQAIQINQLKEVLIERQRTQKMNKQLIKQIILDSTILMLMLIFIIIEVVHNNYHPHRLFIISFVVLNVLNVARLIKFFRRDKKDCHL